MSFSLCGKRLLLSRSCLLATKRFQTGYIVLLPEIGEEPTDKNPLLRDDGLPEFNKVTIENCVAGVGYQAIEMEKAIRGIEESLLAESEPPKDIFKTVIDPLERLSVPLETTWGLANTIYLGNSTLMPTRSFLSIHDRARKVKATKFTSQPIYAAVKAAQENAGNNYTEEQRRILDKYALELRLNGVELNDRDRAALRSLLVKLEQERSLFQRKVESSIKQFQHHIHDAEVVKEFPPYLLQATATNASQPTKGPWRITLQPYIVQKTLEYCPNRDIRWNLWQADTRKASGYTDRSLESSTHLQGIRQERQLKAKLLGYKNYAELSMETKMLGLVDEVEGMLETLLERARPVQEEEIGMLQEYAEKNGFKDKLEVYDVPYWRRKHLADMLHFDDETLREYFPSQRVLQGLFDLSERLFGIRIKERTDVPTWDEDVKFYDIFDASGGDSLGGFYVDLHAREDEKELNFENAGWMINIRNRSTVANTKPLGALIFNFPAPIYGKPSLLTVSDVQLLFNRFGTALQHLLTTVNYSEVAGLSNVEWDMAKVSGHVLAQLLFDPATLKAISAHYSSDEPLSDQKIAAILGARTHLAGYDLCRQLYVSALDMRFHTTDEFWLQCVRTLYPKHFVFELDKKDAHPCSMLDLFSGDWGAAYFSHVHARLIAADVVSAFEEAKKTAPDDVTQVGRRFRDTFLSLGGSCASAEVFRRFRGRDPSPKALIKQIVGKSGGHSTKEGGRVKEGIRGKEGTGKSLKE